MSGNTTLTAFGTLLAEVRAELGTDIENLAADVVGGKEAAHVAINRVSELEVSTERLERRCNSLVEQVQGAYDVRTEAGEEADASLRAAVIEASEGLRSFQSDVSGTVDAKVLEIGEKFDAINLQLTQQTAEASQNVEKLITEAMEILTAVENGRDGRDGIDGIDGKSIEGPQGLKGLDGEDGKDGRDAPLVEPTQLLRDKTYQKNTTGAYAGGLWIANKLAQGDPEQDPHAWTCVLDGITTFDVSIKEDHTYSATLTMGTGKQMTTDFVIPFPEHKGIYTEGEVYLQGNIVTKGTAMWQAMEVTEAPPPGNGWKQILVAPRGGKGPAGKDGIDGVDGKNGLDGKSIEGPRGKNGRNGKDGKDAETDWEVHKLFVEGILYTDQRSASYPLRSFRGWYSEEESYLVGDVVREGSALVVVTQAIPAGSKYTNVAYDSTEVMFNQQKSGAVGGVGGGDSSSGLTVGYQEALKAESFLDQDPTGLGVALQLTVGDPQTTEFFDVDASGNVTCLIADSYEAEIRFSMGRAGAASESQLYTRILIDGVQTGSSSHTILDSQKFELPSSHSGVLTLTVGQVLTFEVIRDTDGHDSGGVKAGTPDVPGWNQSPSVSILLRRVFSQ